MLATKREAGKAGSRGGSTRCRDRDGGMGSGKGKVKRVDRVCGQGKRGEARMDGWMGTNRTV